MARNGASRQTLDETHLLAWIEDELSADDQRVVERALAANSSVRDAVAGMKTDRAQFRAMGDEPAPADLLTGVADLLEREMLVGLTDQSDLAPIPVSKVRPIAVRPAWVRTITGGLGTVVVDRTGRRLALAAGLLIAAGGLTYFVSLNINPASKSTIDPLTNPGTTIARADTDQDTPTPGDGHTSDDGVGSRDPSGPTRPAATRLAQHDPPATNAPDDDLITPARAVELARAGRLVIRVRTGDADRALRLLDRIGERSTSVRVFDALAPALASRLRSRPAIADPDRRSPDRPARDPIAIAGSHDPTTPALPTIERRTTAPQLAGWRVAGLRLVEMDLTERTLAAALRSIAGGGASFEAADAPMDLPTASDPSRVLWWGEPTSAWVPRTVVPVVIEIQR